MSPCLVFTVPKGGFAAGFGVEPFAMVLHQIDDIRRLYNSDLRFLQQF